MQLNNAIVAKAIAKRVDQPADGILRRLQFVFSDPFTILIFTAIWNRASIFYRFYFHSKRLWGQPGAVAFLMAAKKSIEVIGVDTLTKIAEQRRFRLDILPENDQAYPLCGFIYSPGGAGQNLLRMQSPQKIYDGGLVIDFFEGQGLPEGFFIGIYVENAHRTSIEHQRSIVVSGDDIFCIYLFDNMLAGWALITALALYLPIDNLLNPCGFETTAVFSMALRFVRSGRAMNSPLFAVDFNFEITRRPETKKMQPLK